MKKFSFFYLVMLGVVLGICCSACSRFLDVVTDKSISSPTTLEDLESFLWNATQINASASGLLELGTDDYYVNENVFASQDAFSQSVYLWGKEIDFTVPLTNLHWTNPYHTVLLANTILDKLQTIEYTDQQKANMLKGEALFIRSLSFFHLAQVYAPTYDPNTDNDTPGIILKLSSDINERTERANVAETYQQMIDDLTEAKNVLPGIQPYKTRASRAAVEALLSKIYLVMGDYVSAEQAAVNSLGYYDKLINYNTVDKDAALPFRGDINEEVVFFAYTGSGTLVSSVRAKVDPFLYEQFSENDLRKHIFFTEEDNGEAVFKGWYSGLNGCSFTGLSTAELYLTLAECQARLERTAEAISNLKTLLENRYEDDMVSFLDHVDDNDVLSLILTERRKELLFRGTRWSDLRRLNLEDEFQVAIKRKVVVDGVERQITLEPNSPRYVYPLPQTVIEQAGVEQNAR